MSQEDFINSSAKRIRCVAGPGTGKTWSIQRRVERILSDGKLVGSKIFAVTFTRQAAAQLKEKLCNLDVPGADCIVASTLHSYAFKILAQEKAIESLGRHPRPCFESEMIPIRYDFAKEFYGVKVVKEKLKAFESMWARLQNEMPGWPKTNDDKKFNQLYLEWMKFHKAITIGELIPLAVNFLSNNPKNDVYKEFEHIIVDEYQDLNKADQKLIELIGTNSNITIVGDDDQSIYSFRHAYPEGIIEWYKHQSEPKKDIELNLCRRCDGKILALANSLIGHNTNRLNKKLNCMCEREESGDIKVIRWKTRQQETQGIAASIKSLVDSNKIPEGEHILVLAPRKILGQLLLEKLNEINVENIVFQTTIDWSNPELGKQLALLNLYEDKNDFIALRYWLGFGHNTWRRDEYLRLYMYCKDKKSIPQDVLIDKKLCQEHRLTNLKERWDDLQEKIKELSEMDQDKLLDAIFPPKDETKRVGEILCILQKSYPGEKSIKKLLIEAIISLSPTDDDSEAKVKIMTYWGAKGMTSHTVFVTSLVNGILPPNPNPRSSDQLSKLEEYRRLMYVTLTRAKKKLIISSFKKVSRSENVKLRLGLNGYTHWLTTKDSIFFSEMGIGEGQIIDGGSWIKSL